MNYKAQLQIRNLYVHSSPAERKELAKYLKPLPVEQAPVKQCTEPQHISKILPDVLDDIQRRMERAERRERRGHER